jgi:hypothetical protein
MADDAHITIKHRDNGGGFGDIAREELSVTARAFFAPVVGTMNIVRGLLSEKHHSEPAEPAPPKKDAA